VALAVYQLEALEAACARLDGIVPFERILNLEKLSRYWLQKSARDQGFLETLDEAAPQEGVNYHLEGLPFCLRRQTLCLLRSASRQPAPKRSLSGSRTFGGAPYAELSEDLGRGKC
jgi:hypothetical protein